MFISEMITLTLMIHIIVKRDNFVNNSAIKVQIELFNILNTPKQNTIRQKTFFCKITLTIAHICAGARTNTRQRTGKDNPVLARFVSASLQLRSRAL